jgi:PAT family beta-lactamase induction signal transducer AmpG
MSQAALAASTAPATPRRTLVLLGALYAAQGLPFGFFSLALPVLLREAGWSLTAISFMQYLALPWGLKFLWSSWLDHTGSRRSWLLGLQGAAIVLTLSLALLDLHAASLALFAGVFCFNLVAASQDVITDGLAVRLLDSRHRGLANGLQVGAYRLGMVLGGGLLLWVFARFGWGLMFAGMAALLALSTLPVWAWLHGDAARPSPVVGALARGGAQGPLADEAVGLYHAPKPHDARDAHGHALPALALGWWHRARSPGLLTFAALIVCCRLGEQLANSLITPMLIDLHLSKTDIALMKGTVGSASSLVGAALGGWLCWRVGRRAAMLIGGLGQSVCMALYGLAATGLGGMPLLWGVTVLEGVVGTLATVALFTLMMDASDPDHAGTDYTLLASVVVVVGSLGHLLGGWLGDRLGLATTFGMGATLGALGCLALVAWLDRHPTHERVAAAWRVS